MNPRGFTVVLRGVRGSAPSPGAATTRYGGHTSCLEVALSPARRIIFDCGTGLATLQADLPADPGPEGFDFLVFLTHYHLDHIQGLPLFRPIHDSRSRFTFHGSAWEGRGVGALLETIFSPPTFPVRLRDTTSRKTYVDVSCGSVTVNGFTITPGRLNHPQGVTAYRLERGGNTLVYATDTERGDRSADAVLASLADGADVLIHDAQYTPEEYDHHYRGWGHSTWRHAVEAAQQAGVGRLVLFHHDPCRSDDGVDAILRAARAVFPRVEAAHEGMTIAVS